jgi:hypothetical protein
VYRISQFPDDDEHVLGPLSHFEVVGLRREWVHCQDTYNLNVLEVKLNRNLRAQVFQLLITKHHLKSRFPLPPACESIPPHNMSCMNDIALFSNVSVWFACRPLKR